MMPYDASFLPATDPNRLVPSLQHVSINASIYTLVVISLDRYRGIMSPLKGEYSKFKAKLVLVLVWLVSIGLAITNLVVFYVRHI